MSGNPLPLMTVPSETRTGGEYHQKEVPMQRRLIFKSLGVAFVAGLLALSGYAQEKKAEPPPSAEMQEMMRKWQEAMTPGAEHKHLAYFTGTWATETKMWMNGPDAPPEVVKGSSTLKPVLGGRFIQQEMKSTMMGQPWNGVGLLGYDNFRKAYVGSWVDNSSTAILTMEGSANPDHTVYTLEGKSDDPTTGEKGKTMQYVWRIIDKKTHIFEIHDLSIKDKNNTMVEVTYRKKK